MRPAVTSTVERVQGGPAVRVLFSGPYADVGYDVAPDGRFIMVERESQPVTRIVLVQNWFEELKRKSPSR